MLSFRTETSGRAGRLLPGMTGTVLLLLAGCRPAPLPGGQGALYHNAEFGFSLRLPAGVTEVPVDSLNLHALPTHAEKIILVAQQPGQQDGIVCLAAPIDPDYRPFSSAERFIATVRAGAIPGETMGATTAVTLPGGMIMQEIRYQGTSYNAAQAVQVGKALLTFKSNAETPEDLRRMTEAVESLTVAK